MNLPTPLKIVNILGFLLFGVFAFFQYNDIDPAIYYKPSGLDATLWLLFYALIAVLFVVLLFRPVPRWLLIIAAVACIVEMARTAPGLWNNLFGDGSFTMTQASMSAEDPRVELTREFFGALIALAGVAVLWWESIRFSKVPPAPIVPQPSE